MCKVIFKSRAERIMTGDDLQKLLKIKKMRELIFTYQYL